MSYKTVEVMGNEMTEMSHVIGIEMIDANKLMGIGMIGQS